MRAGGIAWVCLGILAAGYVAGAQAPAQAQDSAASQHDIEAFFEEPMIWDVALSPNGKKLVVIAGEDASSYFVVDLDAMAPVGSYALGEGVSGYWVDWATDERLLMGVVVGEYRETFRKLYVPVGRTISFDADNPSEYTVLFDGQRTINRSNFNLARVLDVLPEEPDHVLMPARYNDQYHLWNVNIRSGDVEKVGNGNSYTFDWEVDRNGEPIFRYDWNRWRTVVSVYSPNENGRWRQVAQVRRDDLPEFQPVATHPTDGWTYVIARPEDADRAGIYIYDYHNEVFVEKVAEHPRVDIRGAFTTSRTRDYVGYFTYDDAFVFGVEDARLQAHVEGIREFLGHETSFSIQDMSHDGQVWLIYVSAADNPGQYFVYQRQDARMVPLFGVFQRLGQRPLAATQPIRYLARDGLEIPGYFTPPVTHDGDGPPPLVVVPHGGPELRDVLDYDREVQVLAANGYAVFQPNFRGSGGFGRAFALAGHGEWGRAMQDDVTDGVLHLIDQGVVDGERVCIYGGSYGGYSALAGAAYTPELYQCAISLNGVTHLIDQARHFLDQGEAKQDEWVRSSYGDPRHDRDEMKRWSPAENAALITIPVLLLHGEDDRTVPIDQARKMERALRRAGKDVELIEYEDEGHSYWSRENTIDYLTEVLDFLDTHLQ